MMIENDIKTVFATSVLGFVAYVYALNWELIMIWSMLVVIDVIYGVVAASTKGEYTSRIMKVGLINKAGETLLLITTILAQRVAIINGINIPISSFFLGAFCFKEATSIIETYIKLGHTMPKVLENWFKIANEEINRKEGE